MQEVCTLSAFSMKILKDQPVHNGQCSELCSDLHFRKEIKTIRKTALLMSVMKSLFRLSSTLITGATFIIIALLGYTLDLTSVFLILPLIKVLTNNFMGKIIGITRNLSEFSVTLIRVKVHNISVLNFILLNFVIFL